MPKICFYFHHSVKCQYQPQQFSISLALYLTFLDNCILLAVHNQFFQVITDSPFDLGCLISLIADLENLTGAYKEWQCRQSFLCQYMLYTVWNPATASYQLLQQSHLTSTQQCSCEQSELKGAFSSDILINGAHRLFFQRVFLETHLIYSIHF